jgi:hypothetical protein
MGSWNSRKSLSGHFWILTMVFTPKKIDKFNGIKDFLFERKLEIKEIS